MKRAAVKRMGRPPILDKARARVVFYLRLDQRSQLESAATNWHGGVSTYVREVLCAARVIAR